MTHNTEKVYYIFTDIYVKRKTEHLKYILISSNYRTIYWYRTIYN